jgi:hypothetical protein
MWHFPEGSQFLGPDFNWRLPEYETGPWYLAPRKIINRSSQKGTSFILSLVKDRGYVTLAIPYGPSNLMRMKHFCVEQ